MDSAGLGQSWEAMSPKKGRYNLGSKGVMLLHKIHLLECGIDIEEED